MKRLVIIIICALIIAVAGAVGFYFLQTKAYSSQLIEIQNIQLPASQAVDFDQWKNDQQQETKKLIEARQTSIKIFIAGDIMMSRAVERKMLAKNDFSYCLAPMTKIISQADIAFANLESPIIAGPAVADGSFVFRAHPKSAESLNVAGFDIVSLANNHFGNQGQNGMEKTFDYLAQQGIEYVGAGDSSSQMKNPVIIEKNGIKVAFLAYAYGPDYYAAGQDKAGMALMDTAQLVKDIKAAQKKSDIIIVSMHDGTEYENEPTARQQEFAHLAIDTGADLVVGHHPHVVQKMELYKNKYIYYSLGNFVFDQMWSQPTRQGLSLMFTVNKEGVQDIDYYPVLIQDFCQPNLVEGEQRDQIISQL